MLSRAKILWSVFGLLLSIGRLGAQAVITITFDDVTALSQPAEQYAAQGIHFGSGPYGVIAGLSNGDPGNWGVDGTVGPYFLGFNDPYTETITFDTPMKAIAVDVSRTSGSAPTDSFTLTAFSTAGAVAAQTVTLNTINVWQTVTIAVGAGVEVTSIQLSGSGTGFHPFGVDNLQFTPVPEPSILALLGCGLGGFAWLRRRR